MEWFEHLGSKMSRKNKLLGEGAVVSLLLKRPAPNTLRGNISSPPVLQKEERDRVSPGTVLTLLFYLGMAFKQRWQMALIYGCFSNCYLKSPRPTDFESSRAGQGIWGFQMVYWGLRCWKSQVFIPISCAVRTHTCWRLLDHVTKSSESWTHPILKIIWNPC